jgi:hypothetical protein
VTPAGKRLAARLVRGLTAGLVAFAVLWIAFHLR